MRGLLLKAAIAAVTMAAMFASPSPAKAGANLAYCLDRGGGTNECYYATYEQCQATASGTGAECLPNPDPQSRMQAVPAVRRASRRR
jgi:Protein of unknown function (DUF3551)